MNQKQFSIGEAIGFGWEKFKLNPGFFIALGLIMIATNVVFGVIDYAFGGADSRWAQVINLVSLLVSTFIQIGVLKVALNYVDGIETSLKDIFSQGRHFVVYLISSLIYSIIVLVGLVLLVFPGIIWGIKFSMFGYAIIDRDAGIMGSLTQSSQITMGVKGHIFVYQLLAVLITIAGFLALGVGIFVAMPVIILADAFIYRKLVQQTQLK